MRMSSSLLMSLCVLPGADCDPTTKVDRNSDCNDCNDTMREIFDGSVILVFAIYAVVEFVT